MKCFHSFFFGFFDGNNGPLLFPEFTYSFYPVYSGFYNIPFEKIDLQKDFSINIDDYIREETAGLIIPNPNAPTGIGPSAVGNKKTSRRFQERQACCNWTRRILLSAANQP